MSDGKKVVKVNPSYLKVTEQSGLGEDEPKRRGRKTLKNRRIPKALKEDGETNVMNTIQSSKIDAIKEKLRQQIEEKTRKIREEILKRKEKLEKVITTTTKEDTPVPSLTLKSFHDVFNTEDIQLMDEDEKKMERPRLSGEITVKKEEPKQTHKSSIPIKEEPVYGILKGGTKPTYSEFKKTQKHHTHIEAHNKTVRHIDPPKDWIEKDWKEMTKRNTEINGKKMKLTIGEEITDDEFMGRETAKEKIAVSPFEEPEDLKPPKEILSIDMTTPTMREEEQTPPKEIIPPNETISETDMISPTTREEEQTSTKETIPSNELSPMREEPSSILSIEERQQKLKEFKEKYSTPSSLPSLRKQKIKTLKKSFLLGKYKVRKDGEDVAGHRIGVLIKNNKTRRYIKEHLHLLEKTSMHQIRKYLKQRNMIRAGAEAPDFLLRKLFIDLLSSGEVYNRNGELLLHNFIVDEEEPEKLTLKDEGNLQLDVVLL